MIRAIEEKVAELRVRGVLGVLRRDMIDAYRLPPKYLPPAADPDDALASFEVTLRDIESATGIPEKTMRMWLNGEHAPQITKIQRVATFSKAPSQITHYRHVMGTLRAAGKPLFPRIVDDYQVGPHVFLERFATPDKPWRSKRRDPAILRIPVWALADPATPSSHVLSWGKYCRSGLNQINSQIGTPAAQAALDDPANMDAYKWLCARDWLASCVQVVDIRLGATDSPAPPPFPLFVGEGSSNDLVPLWGHRALRPDRFVAAMIEAFWAPPIVPPDLQLF